MNPALCISTTASPLPASRLLPKIHQHFPLENVLFTRIGQRRHFFQVHINTSRYSSVNAITGITFTSEDILGAGTREAITDLQALNGAYYSFSDMESPKALVDSQHPCFSAEHICERFSFISDISSRDVTVSFNMISRLPDNIPSGEIPNVESLKSISEASINSTYSTIDRATAANVAENMLSQIESSFIVEAGEVLSKVQSAVESPLSVVNATIDEALKAYREASDIFEETKAAILSAVNTSQKTIFGFLTGLEASIQQLFNNAGNSVKVVYDNLNQSILNSLKASTDSANDLESAADAQGGPFNFTSFLQTGTPVDNFLKDVILLIKDSTSAVLETGISIASRIYVVAKGALPEVVRASLNNAEQWILEHARPIVSVFKQAYFILIDAERALGVDPENPVVPVVLITGSTILVGITYWRIRYGGYAGDLSPRAAIDLLKKEHNVVLVDIRSKESKETQGILGLRRQARHKLINIEKIKVHDSIRRLLRDAGEVDNILTAAIIKGLKNVEAKTKVIIIDEDGSQSKQMARVLKKSGIKSPYRIEGGFRSWKVDGLRVKMIGQETVLSIIREETEAIFEEINPAADNIFLIAIGSIGGVYAVFEWEKTLQLLGFIGLAQLVYTRFNSYKNADDLKSDFRFLLQPFLIAAQVPLWISGLVEPNKLQLATSPSTSAVQDRVLQAAAKHGPSQLASEQKDEASPSEGSMPDNNSSLG